MSRLLGKLSGKQVEGELQKAQAVSNGHVGAMMRKVDCPQGQPGHMQAAKQYMNARLAGDQATVMRLISDNIHFVSQRDGEFTGKPAFQQYLGRTKVEGSWEEPRVGEGGLVHIDGQIKWMGVLPVSVKGVFRFGRDGKVEELFVGKR